MDGWMGAAAAVVVDVLLPSDGTGLWPVGPCPASTYCSITSTSIINKSTVGFGERGEAGALRYLLRAPLAFVEDVPEDKHYFGPEQPQSGLERSLHLPFPVRLDTTRKRYVVVFVYTTLSQTRADRREGTVMGGLRKKNKCVNDTTSSACRTSVPRRLRGGGCPTAP